jgi:general secretion pathway protein C
MNKNSLLRATLIQPILLVVGIVYLTYVISDLIWLPFAQDSVIATDVVTTNTVQRSQTLPTHIFGQEQKIVKQKYTKVKQTKLSLVLVGIINKKNHPIAIIKLTKEGADKVYSVGDKINNKAKLKDIGNNFVIIDHNGKDEKLTLMHKTDKLLQNTSQNTLQNQSQTTTKAANIPTKSVTLDRKNKIKLRSYLTKMRTNPASALAVVKVEPNFIAGLLDGFKIFPAKEKKLFDEIGFKAGDIVVQINDIPLNSLSQAFKIGKELALQKSFNFIVKRDGLERSIYLDLQ